MGDVDEAAAAVVAAGTAREPERVGEPIQAREIAAPPRV